MKILQTPSPNFTPEKDSKWGRIDTSLIIVHSTAGRNSLSWLRNPVSRASYHYLIAKDGTVNQLVQDKDVAWHAGISEWKGRTNINRYSIGVAMENLNNGSDPFPTEQINACVQLVTMLRTKYKIGGERVLAHYDISPGRKNDPVGFDISLVRKSITETMTNGNILNGPQTDPIKLHRALNQWAKHLSTEEKEDIVSAYNTYGQLTGIGNLYPFCQGAHEAGWFASERWVKSYNPAGLGATNDGAWGSVFNNAAEGILAQYAHLLCYATTPEENSFLIESIAKLSPRIGPMTAKWGRGSAKTWVQLSGKWAVPGTNYGNRILELGERVMSL